MGRQGFSGYGYGYLFKPPNFLITLAFVAVLVLGIYKLINPIEDTPFAKAEKRIYESHLINYGTYPKVALTQREATLHSLVLAVLNAPDGTLEKQLAQKKLDQDLADRTHVDCAIQQITKAISFPNDSSKLMNLFSPSVVNDWDCYKALDSTYETYCGRFSYYGIQYSYVFKNMCNNGIQQPRLAEIASEVCGERGKCRKVVAENKQ